MGISFSSQYSGELICASAAEALAQRNNIAICAQILGKPFMDFSGKRGNGLDYLSVAMTGHIDKLSSQL